MSWSDYSFDNKAFFAWAGGLMALIIIEGTGAFDDLAPSIYFGGLALALFAFVTISIKHRREHNWHWPGVNRSAWLKAGLTVALMAAFLYVFAQGLLPLNRQTIPMLLFGASIGVWNVLFVLRLVQSTNNDFEQNCGESTAQREPKAPAMPSDPKWKRILRGAYSTIFLIVWVEGMAFFYIHERYVHEGSRRPTATQTESFNEHGTLIYITPEQMRLNSLLLTLMAIGIPTMIFSGFFLHYVIGVRMFLNMPPSRGIFGKSSES